MNKPRIILIAAVARHGAIGRGNDLLWHDSRDQKHFRAVTHGSPVIMGRKTWQSLPERFRPLPGRRNIVISRPGLVVARGTLFEAPGAELASSLEAALDLVSHEPKVFIIGGGQVYKQALPFADELVLTEVDADFPDADTFFPDWKAEGFLEVARATVATEDPRPGFSFVTYRRRPRNGVLVL